MDIETLPVYDRKGLRIHLNQYGIHAEKGLGQHFLADEDIVAQIVRAAATGPSGRTRSILEIGPGPGILTRPLTSIARVRAVEIDQKVLRALHAAAPKAEVTSGDALQMDLRPLLVEMEAPRALVSNIPYYITGPLIERFAAVRDLYDVAVLMIQKEVADRILAPAGHSDRGALSASLQLQFHIHRVVSVPGDAFIPPPKVASTVIVLNPRARRVDENDLMKLIHRGFAQRRKTLLNNLLVGQQDLRDRIEALLYDLGLPEGARAQDIAEEQWIQLFEVLKSIH
jgi:16S rRNA (adenine1518-N6/adenine1519-N6)-dimethyltransferase